MSEVLGHKEVAITLDRYSHALPAMQTEAMARLDAVLGRSPLDRPAVGRDAAVTPALRLETDRAVDGPQKADRHKGPDKGPNAGRRPTTKPDPSVDRAEGATLVPHTGFEPVISALRGRCPGPLDECGAGRRVEATTTADRIPEEASPGSGLGRQSSFRM